MLILRPRHGTDVPSKAHTAQSLDEQRGSGILVRQAVATLVVAVAGLFISAPVALSALLGGAIGTLANGAFAYWVFRRYRAQEPQALVMRFYGAELAKVGLTLVLFVLVFVYVAPLNLPALFGGYLVVQVLPALLAPTSGAARSS